FVLAAVGGRVVRDAERVHECLGARALERVARLVLRALVEPVRLSGELIASRDEPLINLDAGFEAVHEGVGEKRGQRCALLDDFRPHDVGGDRSFSFHLPFLSPSARRGLSCSFVRGLKRAGLGLFRFWGFLPFATVENATCGFLAYWKDQGGFEERIVRLALRKRFAVELNCDAAVNWLPVRLRSPPSPLFEEEGNARGLALASKIPEPFR